MSGRHSNKSKKKKTTHHLVRQVTINEPPCQEHPDNRKEDHMEETNKDWKELLRDRVFDTAALAVFVSVLALLAYFWQACIMQKAMRVDQRAWVAVPVPTAFPLNGSYIPASVEIKDTGKTPARKVGGNFVATVLKKGEVPAIGDFTIGHAYNKFKAPAIFPGQPLPMNIQLVTYGELVTDGKSPQKPIVVDAPLIQDITTGNRFIIFFGRVDYTDIFGKDHWTQFCTGSGSAIDAKSLERCVLYNDFDGEEE